MALPGEYMPVMYVCECVLYEHIAKFESHLHVRNNDMYMCMQWLEDAAHTVVGNRIKLRSALNMIFLHTTYWQDGSPSCGLPHKREDFTSTHNNACIQFCTHLWSRSRKPHAREMKNTNGVLWGWCVNDLRTPSVSYVVYIWMYICTHWHTNRFIVI